MHCRDGAFVTIDGIVIGSFGPKEHNSSARDKTLLSSIFSNKSTDQQSFVCVRATCYDVRLSSSPFVSSQLIVSRLSKTII